MFSLTQFAWRGTLIIASLFCISFAQAATKIQISGQVLELKAATSDTPKPIGFATLVLMDSTGRTYGGTAADGNGNFVLQANLQSNQQGNAPTSSQTTSQAKLPKNLKLVCTSIGYDKYESLVKLDPKTSIVNVEKIYLKPQVNEMKEVVVTARSITREADRFVIKLEGSDKVIGKTALEVVGESPGVWVGNDKLSINGKSGTVVMVNDRVLNMGFDELKLYLSNLNAEDIQRIEVIPNGGAEFDANAQGGIIKITLRRQRMDGLEGSVGTEMRYSKHNAWSLRPNINLNVKTGNLQLYGSGNLNGGYNQFETWQSTQHKYSTPPTAPYSPLESSSHSHMVRTNSMGNFKAGMIYDITKTQSIGFEYADFSRYRNQEHNSNVSELNTPTSTTENTSFYQNNSTSHRRSVTGNYILQLDTLGSSFKFVGDYLMHQTPASDIFENASAKYLISDPLNPIEKDSTYRTNTQPDYKVLTLSADVNYNFKAGHKLSAGAKFYDNTMLNGQLFEEFQPVTSVWKKNEIFSFENIYNERITAAYVKFKSKWKFISYGAGLRAEHTYAHPKTTQNIGGIEEISESTQHYINLFPNINISSPLNKTATHMLVLNYDRKISRPSFWQINPFRSQISEYSYVSGNPDLKPNITDDLSMTYVYKYKYTLTLGTTFGKDEIQQSGSIDSLSPDVFLIRHENTSKSNSYYIALNIPTNPTKWWSLSLNTVGVFQEVTASNETRRNPFIMGNFSNSFTLPKGFIVDFGGFGMSRVLSGNMDIAAMYGFNLGIKRLFLDKKLSISARLDNPILGSNDLRIKMVDKLSASSVLANPTLAYETLNLTTARPMIPTVRLTILYNFATGIKFKAKSVETSNSDIDRRINKND